MTVPAVHRSQNLNLAPMFEHTVVIELVCLEDLFFSLDQIKMERAGKTY